MNINELKKKFNVHEKRSSANARSLSLEISKIITEARIKMGMTQAQLAKKMKTQQPSIARVENGGVLPSLDFLQKMSTALGTELMPPIFEFLTSKDSSIVNKNGHAKQQRNIIYVPRSFQTITAGMIAKDKKRKA